MNALFAAPIIQFAETLRTRSPNDWFDLFANEVAETGGSFTIPTDRAWEHSHMAEISLHGVAAFGFSEAEVMRNWLTAADEHTAQRIVA